MILTNHADIRNLHVLYSGDAHTKLKYPQEKSLLAVIVFLLFDNLALQIGPLKLVKD